MTNFSSFGLPHALVSSLERMKITTPTPIQRETIPVALQNLDILASAQTGTGKTIAYLIPLIIRLLNNPQESALILAPTRELAMQIHLSLTQILGNTLPFKTALIIGGSSMFKQLAALRKKPQLIVGTPGRVTDHLFRKTLTLDSASFFIIDEADRMLDMGFGIQLDKIAEFLPENRQTLMFSATVSPSIEKLSKKYLRNPERISIDPVIQPIKIEQSMLRVSNHEKQNQLMQELDKREGSIIVFVKTKRKAESLCDDLQDLGYNADAMHGDLPQRKREQVIKRFRDGKSRIIIATDVAARGLDIPHIMHVINFDLPECAEDYVHRIGRTGRAGAEGFAVSFVASEDLRKWRDIERLTNPDAKFKDEERAPRPQARRGRPERSSWKDKKDFGRRPNRNSSEKADFFGQDKKRGSFEQKPREEGRRPRPNRDMGERDNFFGQDKKRNSFEQKPREEGRRPRPNRDMSERDSFFGQERKRNSFEQKPREEGRRARPNRGTEDREDAFNQYKKKKASRKPFGFSPKPQQKRRSY